MTARAALLASLVLSAVACGPNPPAHIFEDVTAASGIDFRLVTGPSGERLVVETMAGGLAWIDFDGDGDFDLYLVNAHSDPLNADEPGKEEDRLYRNDGGGRFTDSTRAAGVGDRRYGMGAAAGDCDGDGDQDLLVTNFGRNTLYRNDGKGAFADATEAAGLVERGFNSSAAWFDMDSDGDLDLYVARYLKYHPRTSRRCREGGIAVSCHPRLFPGESDLLYRNRGDGTFEEVSERAGIDRGGEGEGKGLGVLAFDYDRDGLQDVFVANDTTPNFLYRNRGGGAFEDVAQAAGVALSAEGKALAGMGVDAADADGDALTDIYVTNFALEVNSLYLARPGGRYAEAARRTGLGETYIPLGFGTLFLDADLDGDQDIATANGHINEVVETTDPGTGSTYLQRQDLFLNRGDGTFERAGDRAGPFFFAERCVGRGLASSDFDSDGDPDLGLLTLDRSLVLLRNENPLGNRSVVVRLAGKGQRDAYGARIEAEVAGRRQAFEHSSARSYLSACDPRVVIGLGKAAAIDRLTVRWPSGKVTELRGVRPGEVRVEEP
ncbi:MAG: CRTAC1 family protein [Planctomycetes bacterium]|nr:CRTAC1 family protein [Planctomycetota bacterium]